MDSSTHSEPAYSFDEDNTRLWDDFQLKDILDLSVLQSMMDDFYALTGFGIRIVDNNGEIIVSTGWHQICQDFHQKNIESQKNCIESRDFFSDFDKGFEFKMFKCKNNLWDIAAPLIMGDRFWGNIYMGQFLFEDEELDEQVFMSQAENYGYDKERYFEALKKVPRYKRDKVDIVLRFYSKLTKQISMLGFINFNNLISLRKTDQLLTSLAESEKKFRTLFETLEEGVIYHTPEGDVIDANRAAQKILGLTLEQMRGKNPINSSWQFIHENGTPCPREMHPVVKVIKSRKAVLNEVIGVLNPSNDVMRWLLINAIPEFNSDAVSIKRVYASFTDITKRIEQEKKIKSGEERYKAMFNNNHAPMLLIDPSDGKIFDANTAAINFYGYTCDDFCRLNISDINIASKEEIEATLKKVQNGEINKFYFKHRVANGEIRDVEVFSGKVIIEGKNYLYSIIIDITNQKQKGALIDIRFELMNYAQNNTLLNLLKLALDKIGELVASPIGFYHFVNEDEKTISLQQWSTATVESFCKIPDFSGHYPVEKAGIWAESLRTRQTVVHNDYNSVENKKGLPSGHTPIVREMVVPVLRNGKIVAVLGVGNKPVEYSKNDVELVEFIADVTWEIVQNKMHEEELKSNEEKYRLLTENASDVIWVLNLSKNRFTYISPSITNLRGFSPEESLQQTIEDAMTPDSYAQIKGRLEKNYRKFLQNPSDPCAEINEIIQPHKNGSLVWVEISSRFRHNSNGEVEVVGSSRNVSERKRLEAEQNAFLAVSTELANAIARIRIDNLDSGLIDCLQIIGTYLNMHRVYIFITDFENQIWKNTHEWCDSVAEPQIHNLQNVPFSIFPGLHESFVLGQSLIIDDVEKSKPRITGELYKLLKEQEVYAMIISPMLIDGELIGFVGLDDVLSSRKFTPGELSLLKLASEYFSATLARHNQYKLTLEANKELKINVEMAKKLAEKADAANRAKSEFIANISHEIRTPMNSILGFSEIMLNTTTESKQQNYLKTILDSGKTLLALINDILDLSKIESGRFEIVPEPTDIRKLFGDIEQMFEPHIKGKNLSFEIDILPDFPFSVVIDEARLRQILINLVSNAIKFTHLGFVKLTARSYLTENNKVNIELQVADSGIGIGEEEQNRIFEAFTQQSGQDNRIYGGTGLGLTICKKLCTMMNGSISVQSEFGKGSVFTILFQELVYTNPLSTKMGVFEWKELKKDFNGAIVLVVDDIAHNRLLVESYLDGYNLSIIEADNGAMAIELAKTCNPSVILMDIRMPGVDGNKAAEAIKGNPATEQIPIIAVTASNPNGISRLQSPYFDDFMYKPVQKEKLLEVISRFISYKEAQDKSQCLIKQELNTEYITSDLKIAMIELFDEKLIFLQQSMIFGQMQEFAEELRTFSKTHMLSVLNNLAEHLLFSIENFDYDGIQKALNDVRKLYSIT